MFYSRKMVHKVHILLIWRNDHDLTFQELLFKKKSVSLYQKAFQLLTTEIFKSKAEMLLELMNDTNISAVVRRRSVKKVFLETLQNSQEKSCARVSILIKLQA